MAFHFRGTQLRVVRKYALEGRNKSALKKSRFILIEHILPTTEQFIKHLMEAGSEIHAIFAKPYSIDENVYQRLELLNLTIYKESYDDLEDPDKGIIDDAILSAVSKSKEDGKSIILVDVGGYFAEPVMRLQGILQEKGELQYISGIVEDTTFGHNRYIFRKSDLKVPIFSVARSLLKEIEARYVGRDAVISADNVLRECGIMLSNRKALVIGYGMIGSNVARWLRSNDLLVSVYDKSDQKNLQAYTDGFQIYPKRQLIKQVDIIFAATADKALTFPEIEECKDGVILASVGSKDTEFDVKSLKEQASDEEKLGPYIHEYNLQNSRSIRVIKEGTAINFIILAFQLKY